MSGRAHSELPVQSRELQLVWVKDGYQVGIDNDPAWTWKYLGDQNQGELIVLSPDLYYPPSAVSIRVHKTMLIDRGEHFFKRVALAAINAAAKKYQASLVFSSEDLKKSHYGVLNGYSVDFISESKAGKHDTKIFIARNNVNQVLSLTASTLEGKLSHISPVLDRMWGNISFVDGNTYHAN